MAIYLIGTVHDDPQIASRLELALDLVNPGAIFAEGCAEMKMLTDAVRSKGEQSMDVALVGCKWAEKTKEGVKSSIFGSQLSIAEFSAVREYASKRGICWYGLDNRKLIESVCDTVLSVMPIFCAFLKTLSEADAKKTLADMKKKNEPDTNAKYHQFDSLKGKAILSAIPSEVLGERDQQWERIIREGYQKNSGANMAVVCGHGHLLELGNRTLYDRIKDLQPKRAILPDAAQGKYI